MLCYTQHEHEKCSLQSVWIRVIHAYTHEVSQDTEAYGNHNEQEWKECSRWLQNRIDTLSTNWTSGFWDN